MEGNIPTAGNDLVARIIGQWHAERPDIDPSPQSILGRLRRVNDRVTAELIDVYERFGLSEGEFDVMATLRRTGSPYELSPGQIADQTMVTSGAATKRLQRLEARGLIAKRDCDDDARGRRVRLTQAGFDLIDAAFTAHMANEHRLLSTLTPSDRTLLEDVLTRWLAAFETGCLSSHNLDSETVARPHGEIK